MAPAAVTDVDLAGPRADYLEALDRGDRRRATEVALDLLYRGMPADLVLTELVSHAQEAVGLNWQAARWTSAQEHRASAVAEAVILAVSHHALPLAQDPAERAAGRVVVACTEGEWHVLPGRLVTEGLRLRGFEVQFVGPSVPAAELARFLGGDPPAAVAISCSMPASLVGAWHTITALRTRGTTVLCGGRGFGPDGDWGRALGADNWAPDVSAGTVVLREVLAAPRVFPRPSIVPSDVAAEVTLATRELPSIVEAAIRVAAARWPHLARDPQWVSDARGLLTMTMRTIISAVLVGDDRIVHDHVAWAEDVVACRLKPVSLVAEAFDLLLTATPADLPRCLATAHHGVTCCSQTPPTALPDLRP